MKESEVRALCKKYGFSANKSLTRFKNNDGEPWLHIEDAKGYGFIEWYEVYDGYVLQLSYEMVTSPFVAELAEFCANAKKLIMLLEVDGVTKYNIEEG